MVKICRIELEQQSSEAAMDGRQPPLSGGEVVTKPVSQSAAIDSGLRSAGSPQPPPPPDSRTSTSPGRIKMPVSLVLIGRGGAPSE
jgi:hypothetical protein